MNHHDVEVGSRLRAGDEAALAEIYILFAPGVLRWLSRKFARLLPPGEIEDILQEALLIVWQKRGSFDGRQGSVRAWYCGIARRLALKRMERGWVKQCGHETACDSETLDALAWDGRAAERDLNETGRGEDTSKCQSPRESFRAEHLPVMSEILAALSPCECNALLSTGDGDCSKSRAEAAEELGENPNTFRSHLKRAHDKIAAECARRGLPSPDWVVWEGGRGKR